MGAAFHLLFHLTCAAAPSATLADLAEALTEPRILGPEITASLAEYQLGGLRLELSDGAAYPVGVSDRLVGFFFVGEGNATYESTDALSASTFELNARRVSSYKLRDGVLSLPLETALVFDGRGVGTPAAQSEARPPESVVRAFTRHRERFANDRRVGIATQIAQSMVDSSTAPVVIAQLRTAKDDLLYRYDELRFGEESLFIMERYPSTSALRGQRYPAPLATRPLTNDWRRRTSPRFRLLHVDLEVVNRQDAGLDLVVEERLQILAPLDTLELSLWSETFHRRKAHPYTLSSVTLDTADAYGGESGGGESGNEVPLVYAHRDGDLVVKLPRTVAAGDEVRLRFALQGDILHRPGGHSYWWLPIGSWLPLPWRFDMRSFTVHAVVKAAEPFVPFGMGTTIRRWNEGELSCLEFELTDPAQFAVVMAGKYHSYSETRDGQTLTLSSYAFAQDEPMRRIADNVFELIDWYAERLGPFPYPELNILEINAFGFGIAPPGVIYLTAEGFDPGPSGRSFRREINLRLAHEVGHMWWGHVAQMRTPEDQWLSESTAEYFAALAVDDLVGRSGFRDAKREWQEEAGNSKAPPSLYLANHLIGERAAFDRRNLLYARGPLMIHALREAVGDEAFFEIVRRFVGESRFEHVDSAAFIELVNEVSGEDYGAWFAERLFGLD